MRCKRLQNLKYQISVVIDEWVESLPDMTKKKYRHWTRTDILRAALESKRQWR